MRKRTSKGWVGTVATVVLFAAMFVLLLVATSNLSGDAETEGLQTTRQALERATVLCYASEGFYPPGLAYLESKYGVQIDRTKYAVRYDVFASNVMPTIRVLRR